MSQTDSVIGCKATDPSAHEHIIITSVEQQQKMMAAGDFNKKCMKSSGVFRSDSEWLNKK